MTSVCHDIVVIGTFYALILDMDTMTDAECGAGNAYPSGAPDFISGFYRDSSCSQT